MRLLRAVAAGLVLAATGGGVAQAAPELSVSERLQDRRYAAASERVRVIGFQDGRFYANGWHIAGEMGGVWTEPIKLVDGVWFGIDDQWIGPATEFRSGWGYTEMDLPATAGLQLQRTDFAPDGTRAALFGLRMSNPGGAARTVTVKVDAHSELLAEYPWSFDNTPHARDQLPDTAAVDGGALLFREQGPLPHANATEHDYAAFVGSDRTPSAAEVNTAANGHRGPQGTNVCTAEEPPSACDDGPYGMGAGGQLRYQVTVPAGGSETLWVAVAGSDKGPEEARAELQEALGNPAGRLAAKIADRERWGDRTQLSLPGDPRLQQAVDWGKQNVLDLTRYAEDLQIRWLDQGHEYTRPLGEVKSARWVGAGFPDYPWMFATDGEYTAFASVAMGQFAPIKDHLIGLRDVSEILNDGSGIVTHEVISEGSNWFGRDSINPRTGAYDFNTDETVKFPSAVALVWRWTGDDAFRDELYDFSRRGMRAVVDRLDEDGDGWPEGSGNVERGGMGVEKLDNSVYLIRGLYDLADMARSRHDGRTYAWAANLARRLHQRFEGTWWLPLPPPDGPQYADSIDDPPVGGPNNRQQDKHWIGVTPMEAELTAREQAVPGLAVFEHGTQALALRETDCYSGQRPYNLGLFHTGCLGGADGTGERVVFGLNTAIQAVGEGNYGRLGPGRQQRYTDAEAEPMFGQPYTGGTPDEQPGSLPEILPSPDFDRAGPRDANIDRCWSCRAMFVQAWGHYGTVWPVVHQQLGVRPDLGRGALEVVPQLPSSAPIAGEAIRLGTGALDLVRALREGNRYRTRVDTGDAPVERLRIGHTLPRGSKVRSVTLDGKRTGWQARETNRGLEVTVKARPGERTVVVETR
ncbi:MAG: glycogen debranching protein [Solirubrobacteraceae bacterium]